MFEYEKAYRQGEILIFKVDLKKVRMPYGGKLIRIKDGVIREGEKEGHEHKLDKNGQLGLFGTASSAVVETNAEGKSELVVENGNDVKDANIGIINVLKDSARLTHPEHKEIKLPKGDYVAVVQKEAIGKNKSQSVKD